MKTSTDFNRIIDLKDLILNIEMLNSIDQVKELIEQYRDELDLWW